MLILSDTDRSNLVIDGTKVTLTCPEEPTKWEKDGEALKEKPGKQLIIPEYKDKDNGFYQCINGDNKYYFYTKLKGKYLLTLFFHWITESGSCSVERWLWMFLFRILPVWWELCRRAMKVFKRYVSFRSCGSEEKKPTRDRRYHWLAVDPILRNPSLCVHKKREIFAIDTVNIGKFQHQ